MSECSVIIPNCNGALWLKKCLYSLSEQTLKNIEVILVDNGSTDNSIQVAYENCHDIRVIRFSRNAGFAKACNTGIRGAKSDYILLLNNDTELKPDCLEKLLYALKNSPPEVGFASARLMNFHKRDIIDSCGHDFYFPYIAVDRGRDKLLSSDYLQATYVSGACCAAAIFKREALEKIKFQSQYFQEFFFAYYEDVDLDLRLRLTGYKCLYVPDAVCYHARHKTLDSRRTNWLEWRNRFYSFLIYYPLLMQRREYFVYSIIILVIKLLAECRKSILDCFFTVFGILFFGIFNFSKLTRLRSNVLYLMRRSKERIIDEFSLSFPTIVTQKIWSKLFIKIFGHNR